MNTTQAASALAAVMREHRIYGQFAGRAIVGPRTLTLPVTLRYTADLARVMALDEALALRAGIERVRLARERGVVMAEFEMPRSDWRAVDLARVPRDGNGLALGLDTRGRPATVDLHDPATAHLLIAGATGSGKTTLMQSILWQAHQSGARLHIVDAKSELTRFYGIAAHVDTGAATAAAHLADIASDLRSYSGAVVAIDELAALVGDNATAAAHLARIASLGRSLDVHLVAGTQRVDKATLGNRMIVDNTARLVGRVVDAGASALATGQAGMGAHRLSGYGDFLLVHGDNATRFVAAQAGSLLDTLPLDDAPMDPDPDIAGDVAGDWRAVGLVLAASATTNREVSSRLVKDTLAIGSTTTARRLRDCAVAVLDGITAGGAGVFAVDAETAEVIDG